MSTPPRKRDQESLASFARRPPAELRRKDRGQDDAWIERYLDEATVGTLATAHEGQPFINSNLFVFDPDRRAIYLHTAHIGRTRANAEAGTPACFHVFGAGRLLPADEALEFSVEYDGVTAFGPLVVVDSDGEKESALQMLLDKYFEDLKPGEHYRPITGDELERTSVFRLDISEWSGKRKVEGPDFPDAREFARCPSAMLPGD